MLYWFPFYGLFFENKKLQDRKISHPPQNQSNVDQQEKVLMKSKKNKIFITLFWVEEEGNV